MKARDLAALAALGIAGKYAFDKFGNKTAPAAAGKAAPVSDNTVDDGGAPNSAPYGATRGRRDSGYGGDNLASEETIGRRDSGYGGDSLASAVGQGGSQAAVASPVLTRSVKPVSTSSVATTPVAAEDDYPMPRTAPKPVVKAYNSDIMYSDTVPADTRPAAGAMNHLAYKRNQRAGVVPSQRPNDAAAARIARQSASASEIAARQAEIARKEKAFQTRVAFDPAKASSTPLEHSQNVSFAKQYQRGRAKGGVVKMASGGMTSSKMSKPSGASRGDGIAQRGRTRGTLR